MRPLLVVAPLLLAAALAYYIYVPLPDSIEEPWKLTMLDVTFRTVMHAVRSRLSVKSILVEFALICAESSCVSARKSRGGE